MSPWNHLPMSSSSTVPLPQCAFLIALMIFLRSSCESRPMVICVRSLLHGCG